MHYSSCTQDPSRDASSSMLQMSPLIVRRNTSCSALPWEFIICRTCTTSWVIEALTDVPLFLPGRSRKNRDMNSREFMSLSSYISNFQNKILGRVWVRAHSDAWACGQDAAARGVRLHAAAHALEGQLPRRLAQRRYQVRPRRTAAPRAEAELYVHGHYISASIFNNVL